MVPRSSTDAVPVAPGRAFESPVPVERLVAIPVERGDASDMSGRRPMGDAARTSVSGLVEAGRPAGAVDPGAPVAAASDAAAPEGAPSEEAGAPELPALRFPVETAKVTRPPLRDETLSRERLLDWLDSKIHHRVVLLTAEAGYGKTTLLADFTRRTRLRVAWVRLDEEERDPVALLNYLVATGRRLVPGFAPVTGSLLADVGTGPTAHETLVRSFVRELRTLGDQATLLVLDDVHLVDDAEDVRSLLRAIVAGAPERLTIVMASRRRPRVPFARLRTLGEVVELGAEDLRFRPEETERLFRETYRQPLEPDVLTTLTQRTEGWAASLQLAHTALRGRSGPQIRSFVNGLSGTMSELHDYLAEEVVGDLAPEAQAFLMRVAVLQVVDVAAGAVAGAVDEAAAHQHIETGERAGLLGRRGDAERRTHRYHPLVQEFLLERLRRDIGEAAIRDLHRRVAAWAEDIDWRMAAHHYAAAGDASELHRVLAAAIGQVMASGEFSYAESLVERLPPPSPDAALDVFLSRLDFYRNRPEEALLRAAEAARQLTGPQREVALANQAALEYMTGNVDAALAHAKQLGADTGSREVREVGLALAAAIASGDAGDLQAFSSLMESMYQSQLARGERHYAGISALNLAYTEMHRARATEAATAASNAVDLLRHGAGPEASVARCARAWATAHLSDVRAAADDLREAELTPHSLTHTEVLIESAAIELSYGSLAPAETALRDSAATAHSHPTLSISWHIAAAEAALRRADPEAALALLDSIAPTTSWGSTGLRVRLMSTQARVGLAASHPEADGWLSAAEGHAARQRATYWSRYCELLRYTHAGNDGLNEEIQRTLAASPATVSILAEETAARVADLDRPTLAALAREVDHRPERWRDVLRRVCDSGDRRAVTTAGSLLEGIGQGVDIGRLRAAVKRHRLTGADGQLGRGLARRLAAPVVVSDLGPTTITLGTVEIPGGEIRRKVLALLVLLGSRPSFAATRDQVVDALWPDQTPKDALNSLNQTLYFLRRVFEPDYDEDVSPGYVHYRGDLLWLDPELVSTQSQRCRELLEQLRRSLDWDAAEELSRAYTAPFALDFAYDDWADGHRAALHNAYLETMERAVHAQVDQGLFEQALPLARRAVEVDGSAENLHVLVIGICRQLGAHAAAAEQYATYAAYMRDELGVDPRPFESIRHGSDR